LPSLAPFDDFDEPLAWADAWCAWCGDTLPLERDPRRKFCDNNRECETAYHNDRRAQRSAAARSGKTCARCSKPFVAPKAHRIYCSRECAVKACNEVSLARKSHERAQARIGRTCRHCEAPISPERKKGTIYCGDRCQQQAIYQRRRAR
jgi:hypothetical protein